MTKAKAATTAAASKAKAKAATTPKVTKATKPQTKVTQAIRLDDLVNDPALVDILSDDEAKGLYEEAKHVPLAGTLFASLAAKAAETDD